MASPESTPGRSRSAGPPGAGPSAPPVRKTIPQAMTSTTMVRMAVAKVGLDVRHPQLAKEGGEGLANTAEPRA